MPYNMGSLQAFRTNDETTKIFEDKEFIKKYAKNKSDLCNKSLLEFYNKQKAESSSQKAGNYYSKLQIIPAKNLGSSSSSSPMPTATTKLRSLRYVITNK